MLRLNTVNGISSFALFLSDSDNEENSLLSGISDPKSTSSSIRDFILIRILNKDYKILFSMNGNIIEKFKEAIKVSYFICINKNDDNQSNNNKRSINIAQKEIKNNDSNTSNKTNKSNTIESSGEVASNFNKLEEKKQISKPKKKSFARIPVQFHEFKNVRSDSLSKKKEVLMLYSKRIFMHRMYNDYLFQL